jgi:hypothetical protein
MPAITKSSTWLPRHCPQEGAARAALRVKGREIGMNPRQIKNRSNLANWVIVRNCLIKMKRIKQLLLVVIEPPHYRSPPQRIA